MDLNGFLRSGPNGLTVPGLSPQVRAYGPHNKTGTKSGPTYPPPPKGAVGGGGPFQIIQCNTDNTNQGQYPNDLPDGEPSDEELWLEDIARQVEADARPLFALTLAWLFKRALELDDNEPPT